MLINTEIVKIIREKFHARAHNNDYKTNNLGFGLLHYAFIRNIKPQNVLVVGSQRGYAPAICGLACKDEGIGTVDFVDAGYETSEPHAWGGLGIWKTATKDYWKPIGCENIIKLHNMRLENFSTDKKYQYIYVDGDHSYEGVKRDFYFCVDLLDNQGYMTFHDVSVDKDTDYGKCGVKDFWHDISRDASMNDKFEFLTFPYSAGLGFVRKKS